MLGHPGHEVEEGLFSAALALPASERALYLKHACNGNGDLLERLNALIDSFGDAKEFITDASINSSDGGPAHIGSYRLLQELGEGGCGIAFLAEQTSPVKRQVALKVIKPGMDTRAVIGRFEAERQVLALLDHPNIAKVFDAGTTSEGRPYFVMELVRGIRITEYCFQSRMSLPQRLSLFIQVCLAIQHAHQRGIIHRDIKPSNVLVTMHNGLPLAKVIDFGIAKATQGRLIDQTLHTEIDQIIGTPAYISPEQTRATPVAVDTRSDIYSLGVLLYELLTGHTPFDADQLAEAGIEGLRARICTEEPTRPSRRLTSLDAEVLERLAIGGATTAPKLVRQIRDDLDWVVMKCLEKEPARRYQTVNDLVADIDRYLRYEPVLARPPNLIYRVRKLARRNRIAFVSALATVGFAFFITIFAIITAIQSQQIATERDQAELERRQAQQVSNVILDVFAFADPFQSLDSTFTGAELLDRAARSIKQELRDQPAARARMLQVIGRAYTRRGEQKLSVEYLTEAVQILSQIDGSDSETLTAMIDLSYALRISGDLEGARELLKDGEDLTARSGLMQSAAYARLHLNRGRLEIVEGRIPEAQAAFNRSLELYRKVVGSQSTEVAEAMAELSEILVWLDDSAAAEQLARRAIAIFDATIPTIHPDRVKTETVLAEALYLQNHFDEAASILVDAIPKNTQLFGRISAQTSDILDRLAAVRYSQGRFSESETISREALATARTTFGQKHVMIGNVAITLARTLMHLRKYPEAERTLREALDILAATVPEDHQYVAAAEYFLGEVLLATQRPREAETVLTASMKRWQRAGAPPWRAMRSASALGEALYRQGRIQEAETYLTESLRILSAETNSDDEAKEKARARFKRYVKNSTFSDRPAPTELTVAAQ